MAEAAVAEDTSDPASILHVDGHIQTEQGLDRERALLCRMTVSRFGVATAERLAELLAPITDAEGLADIGDWLVQCDTGDDFLARVGTAPA